jgi:hypothetical protein
VVTIIGILCIANLALVITLFVTKGTLGTIATSQIADGAVTKDKINPNVAGSGLR